ncbi:MAG TPA: hypothetical protein PKD37_07080 [Oligoflexia bacterium]|nr:hypothetical protein [Oligoflexia bacterium]HMP27726.1 hypothetical protein [Oligoflexia bacterium]
MDNGEEIPGLNEDWNFAGAKAFEWLAGLVMMLLFGEIFTSNMGRAMPLLIMVMIGTTLGLAALRRQFPDEERGVRNLCMVAMGFAPPGIPKPAALQPIWSGAPVREVNENSLFYKVKLSEIFPLKSQDLENDDGNYKYGA